MHLWFDLISRELALLVVVTALGLGPSSFLSERFDATARLAMAPVLGMCTGAAVFTTLLWFASASRTAWLLPVIGAGSCAVAVVRRRHWRGFSGTEDLSGAGSVARRRSAPFKVVDIVQLAVVCLAAAAPITYTLHERGSVGPAAYAVGDVDGYVAVADGAQHQSLRTAQHQKTPFADFTVGYYDNYAAAVQQLDVTALLANLDSLLGFGATDTNSPFLAALIVVGALGVFSAVRATVRRRSWAAVLAGGLFGGAFFLQLFFVGSEGAICGLAVLVPMAVVGGDALHEPGPANVALFALLVSGLIDLYPLLLAPAGVAAVVAVAAVVVRRARSVDGLDGVFLLRLGGGVASVLVLAALFDVVAFARVIHYWHSLVNGGYVSRAFPQFQLGAGLVPGWLLQTRQLYSLVFSSNSAASNVVLAILVPAALLAVAAVALWRFHIARLLIPFIATSVAIALYERVHNHCSYCEERNLLPVAPMLLFLVALGVGVLATSRLRRLHWASLGVAALFVVSAGYAVRAERTRFLDGAYVLDSSARTLVSKIPPGAGPVALEGFNEGAQAPEELLLVYEMVDEHVWGRVSIPADYDENNALAYAATYPFPGPTLHPASRYVLTRIPGVLTSRPTVARMGSIALQRLSGPLDVLLDYGVSVASLASSDPTGSAHINSSGNGTVQYVVSGGSGRGQVHVAMRFDLPAPRPLSVAADAPMQEQQHEAKVDICVETTGRAPLRTARVRIPPDSGARLVAVEVGRGCPSLPVAG
jgi:hypothetical protein